MKTQKEVIQGEIVYLDFRNRYISLRRTDAGASEPKEKVEIFVPEGAQLKRIDSLMNLDCGDIIRVDVVRNGSSQTLEAHILESVA